MDRLRESASSVLGPIERAAAAVVNPVSDFIDGLTSINSNADTIDQLEAENAELRRQQLTSDLNQTRVDELDKLLHDRIVERIQDRASPGNRRCV